ncbi:MAG: hypothetical protein OXU51_07835 [Candidatus Poribacteria bacterium]|nr:hypothetical protein [Candidatus Poribacteria bacterium]
MIDIQIDGLSRLQAYVTQLEHRLTDRTRLFSDFIAPLVAGEIAEVFETEGRGEWPALHPAYAAEKAITHPGKTILRRDDTYIQAATSTAHPGNIAHFGPSEMIWGIDGGYFEAVYGENYPEQHELGTERLPSRPVFDLITVGGRLDENIEKLTEKWVREEIAEIEGNLF